MCVFSGKELMGLSEFPKPPQKHRGIRILGIPIHLDPSWFLILAFLAWSNATGYFPSMYDGVPTWIYWLLGVLSALLLYVCIVLHELGHSLVAKAFGIPVTCVTLFIFGGAAQIAQEPKNPREEFLVAAAGPLVSAVISLVCFKLLPFLWPVESLGQFCVFALVDFLASVNLMLLIFNLLPGFPLDGGRIFRAVLWYFKRDYVWATRIASYLGLALAYLMIARGAWFLFVKGWMTSGLWYGFLGYFLRNAAQGSLNWSKWAEAKRAEMLRDQDH